MFSKNKITVNFEFLREDLRKIGLACLAAGNAGIFLNTYSVHYGIIFFVSIVFFGAFIWLLGLFKKRST